MAQSQSIVFGITGGIACGKSTVTKTFLEEKIPIVDADLVARDVVTPGSIGLALLAKKFGKEIIFEDNGELDRRLLATIAFQDQNSLNTLNEIMHPLIEKESMRQIKKLQEEGAKLIGYDAALIMEMGKADHFRPLILVMCKLETQIQRLMKRNMLTKIEATQRIASQMSSDEKAIYADFIINTDDTIENSKLQTKKIIQQIKELS